METPLNENLLTYEEMFEKEKGYEEPRIERIGYPNSSVLCKTTDELIGVISHGSVYKKVSSDDAVKIASYLVDHQKAERVIQSDGHVWWNIYSNKNSAIPEPKFDRAPKAR